MTTVQLKFVESDEDYQSAFEVMQELRPHLRDVATFTAQIRRQMAQEYRLLAAWVSGKLQGVAGYRLQENLLYGRFLYLDDLVTTKDARRDGIGKALIDACREEALRQKCANFVLDTGLGNGLGQRFYFRQGLLAVGMHFRQSL